MHIHVLGIGGTFMSAIATIAQAMGDRVTGSDKDIYPPVSDLLMQQGIRVTSGYAPEHLQPRPDLVLIGNALSRGEPVVEYILNESLAYMSAPEWLNHKVLSDKHVLAVAGTHGKTTTTAMLAWLLESAGLSPGFLIGGVAENFGLSARYCDSRYFVIEADEYDTAFFDKRSKFIHYRPGTLIINNIEFDHGDIFSDISAIRREFHHLIRILPGRGRIIALRGDPEIERVFEQGCWTPVSYFGEQDAEWRITAHSEDHSNFSIRSDQYGEAEVHWPLLGRHNAYNALAAVAAAHTVGVGVKQACAALAGFKSVKRRLECIADIDGIRIYDDFAHHPTAINATLTALRRHVGDAHIVAVIEPCSYTMRTGGHRSTLATGFAEANQVLLYQSERVSWDMHAELDKPGHRCRIFKEISAIVEVLLDEVQPGAHVVIMSNGGFGGIHQKLIKALQSR